MTNSINWNIESMRVTTFQRGSFDTRSLETWLESTSENLPIQVSKTGASCLGVSRSPNGFIRANWNGHRFDVVLTSGQPDAVAHIASFTEVKRLFGWLVDAVPRMENLPVVDRIALGVILTASVESDEQGIDLLRPVIRGLEVDPRVRDFLYRANYPIGSHSREGVNINRLATWSVGQVQIVQLQIRPDGSQNQQVAVLIPKAIRLELDISTDQSVMLDADSEVVARLLTELEQMATDIADNGESSMLA